MWNEKERAIAKTITDPETIAFLEKVFLLATSRQLELKAKYDSLNDAEYGQLMKVIELSRKENEYRIALIKSIAKEKKEKPSSAIAPR